jgi:hypothetical protein
LCVPLIFLALGCGGAAAPRGASGGSAGADETGGSAGGDQPAGSGGQAGGGVGGGGVGGGGAGGRAAPDADVTPDPDAAPPVSPDADAGVTTPPDASTKPVDAAPEEMITCARQVPVKDDASLAAALGAAKPGDCLVLADGSYTAGTIKTAGTAAMPIVIRAANRGKAVFAKGALHMTATWTTIEGITWTSSGTVTLTDCQHCRLTRWTMKPVGITDTWITITGTTSDGNRVDHGDFGPKNNKGRVILPTGTEPILAKNTRIDHNYFHDGAPTGSNGFDTVALGAVGAWGDYQDSFSVVEDNLFVNCDSDEEIVSIKTSSAIVRHNTIRTSNGMLSIRSGTKNQVSGNYILGGGKAGTGGIKMYEDDHLIFNNYVDGVPGYPLLIGSGTPRGPGFSHAQVRRAKIVHNTFIVTGQPVLIGHGSPLPVEDTTIADNVIVGTKTLIGISVAPLNMTYQGNIANGTLGIPAMAGEFKMIDPQLVKTGEVMVPGPMSPVIDAAVGSFPFLTEDIDGNPRSKPDVGAFEVGGVRKGPLTQADVGPDAP